MRFYRIAFIVLALVLTFSFVGCSGETEKANEVNQKITITEDGKNGLKEYKKGSSGWSGTSSPKKSSPDPQGKTVAYCANKKSMKFHLSDCGSVDKIKPENKYETNDRSELINAGYSPCAICNP